MEDTGHNLLEDEKMRRGKMLAEIFNLKLKAGSAILYGTAWGTKTALGIYETAKRIIEEGA